MATAAFDQCDRHTAAGQEQGQRGSGRTGSDDQNVGPGLAGMFLVALR